MKNPINKLTFNVALNFLNDLLTYFLTVYRRNEGCKQDCLLLSYHLSICLIYHSHTNCLETRQGEVLVTMNSTVMHWSQDKGQEMIKSSLSPRSVGYSSCGPYRHFPLKWLSVSHWMALMSEPVLAWIFLYAHPRVKRGNNLAVCVSI